MVNSQIRLAAITLVAWLTACGVEHIDLGLTPDAGGPDAAPGGTSSGGRASGSDASMSGKGGSSARGGALNQGGTGAVAGRAGGAGGGRATDGGGATDGSGAAGAETGGTDGGSVDGGGTEAGTTCDGGLTACGTSCVNVMGNDPANCGACRHSCLNTAAGACVAGRCQPIVLTTVTVPVSLAVNESNVFWQEFNGAVLTISTTGGTRNVYVGSSGLGANSTCTLPTRCLTNLTTDATNLYWPSQSFMPENPIIQSITLGGNSPYAYGSTKNPSGAYTFVMPDATDLYAVYTSLTTQGGSCPSLGVDWTPISPRSTTTTNWKIPAFCRMNQIAFDATNLYWTDLGSPNGVFAAGVFMAPKKGTTSTLIEAASIPTGIAVYDGVLYWTDSGTGAIKRWPGSGTPTTLSTSSAPGWLAVDSSGVYWIDSNESILRAPLTGSDVTPETLASSQVIATQLATNSTAVFWIRPEIPEVNFGYGSVMKVAK
jgi:hypothetical protein